MRRVLLALLFTVLSTLPLAAQYQWAEDGVPIRQGAHLGWNGSVVACGDEVVAFYYHCLRDGTRDLWAQRYTSAGAPRWDGGLLVSGNISEQRFPVAVPYPDGSVFVVWEDYGAGRYRDLNAQRLDASGMALWPGAYGVTVVTEPRDQFSPMAAVDGDYTYVAWTDDRETISEQRLSSWAQIFADDGSRIGPDGGIRLADRIFGYCSPVDIAAANGAAYVLMEGLNNGLPELILQKLLPDGTVAWPEDPAIITEGQPANSRMIGIDGGLAVAWQDYQSDFNGDLRLLLIDYNRAPFPGWPGDGIVVAAGPGHQVAAALTQAPGGDIVVAWGASEFDQDLSALHLSRYSVAGSTVFTNLPLGTSAIWSSPVDLVWEGSDLLIGWADRFEYSSQTVRTQKVTAAGQRLWGDNGNAILMREGKALRADLVKPQGASPQLFMMMGRTIAQPESVFTTSLNAQGAPSGGLEQLPGGMTYDAYDPQVVRVGEQRALLVWSDTRDRATRDVFVQFIDGQGETLLEPQGRKITSGNFNIIHPPAIAADGQGGAFVAWAGDSLGTAHTLFVQHVSADGALLWPAPARVSIGNGMQSGAMLVADNSGGVYAAYAAFSPQYVLRLHVAHVGASGQPDWSPPVRDLSGFSGSDMLLGDACGDGSGGLFVAATVGPWTDTDIGLYHLNSDGTPGENWTLAGRTYGEENRLERTPQLLEQENGVVLAYMRVNNGSFSTYSIQGVAVDADGAAPWGLYPRSLVAEGTPVVDFRIAGTQEGFFIAWDDWRDSTRSHVRINAFDANGDSRWDAGGLVAATDPGFQEAPALTPDASGGVWLVWEDHRHADEWGEIDLFATHFNASGGRVSASGFTWPEEGYPLADLPTYQDRAQLVSWAGGGALAVWMDRRSSNPGRCCGAGAVGDIFENVYAQVLSEGSLNTVDPRPTVRGYELQAAYPNPFNPATTIEFAVPVRGHVKLAVYDLLGREVAVLRDGLLDAGAHRATWNGDGHASGLYFVRLHGAQQTAVKKLLLMK